MLSLMLMMLCTMAITTEFGDLFSSVLRVAVAKAQIRVLGMPYVAAVVAVCRLVRAFLLDVAKLAAYVALAALHFD
jgi:hypothetical protein